MSSSWSSISSSAVSHESRPSRASGWSAQVHESGRSASSTPQRRRHFSQSSHCTHVHRASTSAGEEDAAVSDASARFRSAMTDAGFTLTGEGHPIIPVMLGDADLAGRFAVRLLAEGVYATAFSFPVVPNGTARIRTQMNADHTDADLDVAVAAFTKVGQELGVVS